MADPKRLLIAAVVLLTACTEEPVERMQTNNDGVPLALLFQHDGCNVYRFLDGGRHHYYADCGGTLSKRTQTTSTGKTTVSTTYVEDVPNGRPRVR
jgi:hypothetical protein